MADATTLERCPLFSPLPSRVMVSLAPRFHDITVAAGQVLCRAGDPAAALSQAASMKSGPFLNAAVLMPRRANSAKRLKLTSVLPESPAIPAITRRGNAVIMLLLSVCGTGGSRR